MNKELPRKVGRPKKAQPLKMDLPADNYELGDLWLDNILVMRKCPNPDFVIGRLDGCAINIRCGRKFSNKLIGKKISVMKPKDEDIYYYSA